MASSRLARNEADSLTYLEHFNCNICLEVLTEPVQCANNEHYFCKTCISEHLKRRQNCPVCRDNLTASTLRSPSRVVADILRQMQSPKCRYVSRGCTTEVTYETFWSHHEECGFAPVECPYKECSQSMNRQELSSHQENCEFRTVTCEDCGEVMKPNDYGKHVCVLKRKIDENTRSLLEIKTILQEIQAEQQRQCLEIQRLTNSESGQVSTAQIERRPAAASEVTTNLSELSLFETSSCPVNETSTPAMPSSIFVTGGDTSYEVFNWATQTWTLYKDALFCDHRDGSSFVYDNKVMICGGRYTDKVECLDLSNNRAASTFPVQLPSKDYGKGVRVGDRIFYFKKSISATSLTSPFSNKVIKCYNHGITCHSYGIARTNDNKIVIVGGIIDYPAKPHQFQGKLECTENVWLCDPESKVGKKLAPLPYQLSRMAVVVHDDDVIILGGCKQNERSPCKDVLKYNLTTQQCSKLPSMLKTRSNFAAVILGDTIVAIGNDVPTMNSWQSNINRLQTNMNRLQTNTAEYLVLGENTWKELPPMHRQKYSPIACLMP